MWVRQKQRLIGNIANISYNAARVSTSGDQFGTAMTPVTRFTTTMTALSLKHAIDVATRITRQLLVRIEMHSTSAITMPNVENANTPDTWAFAASTIVANDAASLWARTTTQTIAAHHNASIAGAFITKKGAQSNGTVVTAAPLNMATTSALSEPWMNMRRLRNLEKFHAMLRGADLAELSLSSLIHREISLGKIRVATKVQGKVHMQMQVKLPVPQPDPGPQLQEMLDLELQFQLGGKDHMRMQVKLPVPQQDQRMTLVVEKRCW
jgi:hypothetical protein